MGAAIMKRETAEFAGQLTGKSQTRIIPSSETKPTPGIQTQYQLKEKENRRGQSQHRLTMPSGKPV